MSTCHQSMATGGERSREQNYPGNSAQGYLSCFVVLVALKFLKLGAQEGLMLMSRERVEWCYQWQCWRARREAYC